MQKLKWGIVSTGNIANQFAQGVSLLGDCEIAAVCSRSEESAKAFASRYGIPKTYTDIKAMAQDSALDIIYVGTPNSVHIETVPMLLQAGRHVLCEKPMGLCAKETQQMIRQAKQCGQFLMEGMWTRFFPPVGKAMEWLRQGRIGKPKMLFCNFGYDGNFLRGEWRFNAGMGGGALLDVGVYTLAMTFLVFGTEYTDIRGECRMINGVDEYNAFTLQYGGGEIAVLSSAISLPLNNEVYIEGETGRIIIRENWWRPVRCELFAQNGIHEIFEHPYTASGFQFEAAAVCECIKAGMTESPLMPLSETLKIAQAMDALKKYWH